MWDIFRDFLRSPEECHADAFHKRVDEVFDENRAYWAIHESQVKNINTRDAVGSALVNEMESQRARMDRLRKLGEQAKAEVRELHREAKMKDTYKKPYEIGQEVLGEASGVYIYGSITQIYSQGKGPSKRYAYRLATLPGGKIEAVVRHTDIYILEKP